MESIKTKTKFSKGDIVIYDDRLREIDRPYFTTWRDYVYYLVKIPEDHEIYHYMAHEDELESSSSVMSCLYKL